LEPAQGGELFGDECGEGRGCGVFDITEEMLDADFFGFFSFNG
jgi:hypothetical protein